MKSVITAAAGMSVSMACLVMAQVQGSGPSQAQQGVSVSSQPSAQQSEIGSSSAPAPSSSAKAETPPQKGAFIGIVASVDPAGKKISAKDEKGEVREFLVGAECRIIQKGGMKKTLGSIKPDQSIIINHDGNKAMVIHVGGHNKKAAKKAAKAETAPLGQSPAKASEPIGP